MLGVCISSVAGDTLEIELEASDTIASVKHAVASTWSIPCTCQRVVTDSEVLEDDAIIERCMRSNPVGVTRLILTVVVSLDVVRSNINCKDACSDVRAAKRVFALQELGILGLKGGHAGIALVVNCLEEKEERVCRAAIDALSKFAAKGNQDIIAALVPKLKHKRCNVKRVALEFLGQLAEVGDRNVITEVCSCLEQHVTSAEITAAAIETLGTLALQGDRDCITLSLTQLLCHRSKLVRKAGVQSLTKLAERGVAIKISAVSGCLVDTQPEVRIATLKAIAKIAVKGDQNALRAVSGCVADAESSVRLAALCAMAEIAEKGDENAFAYSRLLGGYRRRSGQGTSTSSDDGRTTGSTHPPGAALDSQSQASNSSSVSSAQPSPGGLLGLSMVQEDGRAERDCNGSFCQRRDGGGAESKCMMQ